MTGMLDVGGGALTVALELGDDRVSAVTVTSTRPIGFAAPLLAGRSVDQGLALVPNLFAVCGTGQTAATVAACEMALGVNPGPRRLAARQLAVLAEAAENHIWQLLVEWPRLMGEPIQPGPVVAVRTASRRLREALWPDGDGLRLGGGRVACGPEPRRAARTLGETLSAGVPGLPTLIDADGFHAWIERGGTPAARLLGQLAHSDLIAFGADAPCRLLPPELPAAWFASQLTADPRFSERPRWNGKPAETGCLARQADHPVLRQLVRAMQQERASTPGFGVFTRFAARILDVAALVPRLNAAAARLDDAEVTPDEPRSDSGCGAGCIETARGTFAIWVRIEQGLFTSCRTAAPTEWNLHPEGILAEALVGANGGGQLGRQVQWLVAALDPCVPYSIEIGHRDCQK